MKALVACRYGAFREALCNLMTSISPASAIVAIDDASTIFENTRNHTPDIVFLDLISAKGEGIRLALKVKSAFPRVIIAVMASFDYIEYRRVIHDLGIDYYIPVESMDREMIQSIIGSAEPRA